MEHNGLKTAPESVSAPQYSEEILKKLARFRETGSALCGDDLVEDINETVDSRAGWAICGNMQGHILCDDDYY